MVSEYPREQQNPPMDPGQRPEDQPAPRQRVPDHYHQSEGGDDPRFPEREVKQEGQQRRPEEPRS
jgi:hypothetical protein